MLAELHERAGCMVLVPCTVCSANDRSYYFATSTTPPVPKLDPRFLGSFCLFVCLFVWLLVCLFVCFFWGGAFKVYGSMTKTLLRFLGDKFGRPISYGFYIKGEVQEWVRGRFRRKIISAVGMETTMKMYALWQYKNKIEFCLRKIRSEMAKISINEYPIKSARPAFIIEFKIVVTKICTIPAYLIILNWFQYQLGLKICYHLYQLTAHILIYLEKDGHWIDYK